MKAIYNEFFRISEDGRIRDKVMLVRTAVSVVFMVICLAAMSISAYAYFSCDVSSGMNMIQSAYYDLKIQNESNVMDSDTFICTGAENDTYTFTLTPNGTADNGYCKIVISDGTTEETYYTTQIFQSAGENNDRLTSLSLKIRAAVGCTITFIPQWGTSSYYIGNEITLYGNKGVVQHSTTPVQGVSTETTEPTTETTTTTQQEEVVTPESTTEPTAEPTTEPEEPTTEETTEPEEPTTPVEEPEETTNTEIQE